MLVFTLPSFPYVFKVIRDEFPRRRTPTREEVRAKYLLVKYHDRVGRLPDAMEYSDVPFPPTGWIPRCSRSWRELRPDARPGRRWTGGEAPLRRAPDAPLDIFLGGRTPQQYQAIREFGLAIRDLAAANIFPGDLLLRTSG